MKKIRIELKSKAKIKPILVFDSSEALYLWLNDVGAPIKPNGSFIVSLTPGDFIEAEWQGCEYVYEGNDVARRLDYIRLAKSAPTKNASGMLVSIHYGWITADQMQFKNVEDEFSTTRLLLSPDEWRLDLGTLFQDGEDGPDGEDGEDESTSNESKDR